VVEIIRCLPGFCLNLLFGLSLAGLRILAACITFTQKITANLSIPMKKNLLLYLSALALLSSSLFSCQSLSKLSSLPSPKEAQSHSATPLANADPLTVEPGQSAATSQQSPAMQSDELQADASVDPTYVPEASTAKAAERKHRIQEQMQKLSPKMKASLQQAQEVLKSNQADRAAGKKISRAAKKQERRALKSVFREARNTASDDQFVAEVILAVLLPPLGVYLHEDDVNDRFWIAFAGWAAGIIFIFAIPVLGWLLLVATIAYALLVVTDSI
jgi:hypothetical protein